MSNVKLRTPSNGSVTLSPQDTASDVVLTVPAGTSTVVTNATLPTQLNATGSAPIYACRAWVNFDGTGTPTIRASGNVSSITDNGTGDYTVNFTTAMPDANYSVSGSCLAVGTTNVQNVVNIQGTESSASLYSTTQFRIVVGRASNGVPTDNAIINISVFR